MKDSQVGQNKESLTLDVYGDEKTITRILNRFVAMITVGICVGIIVQFTRNDIPGVILRASFLVPILAAFFFVRRKKIELAIIIFAVLLITLITAVATRGEGIHHISIIAYPPVLIIASLVVRKQNMILLTAYNILCVTWLVFGEIYGYYTPEFPRQSTIADYVILSLVLVFTAFMVRLLTETLFENNLRLNKELEERKRIEEQRETLIKELEARNTELLQFTYTVSHDLKSPLVTIKGFLGYLEEHANKGRMDRFKADMSRISNAVEKMYSLLNDLLELSRIGRMINPPEVISFEELVRNAMELVPLSSPQITVKLAEHFPIIYGDKQRLTEVIQNLLDNALKFMGDQPSPQIEIGFQGMENDRAIFFVKDNGMGIAPEYHEQVFGLFNRLHLDIDGTGVGLALVRRIIEFHGGRVWVESALGQGSTFYFTISTIADKTNVFDERKTS